MHKNSRKHSHSNYDLHGDLEKIKHALADTAADLRGKTSEYFYDSYEDVKDKTADLREQLADYTAEKPIKTLGIVFLAGMIIGYLFHKK